MSRCCRVSHHAARIADIGCNGHEFQCVHDPPCAIGSQSESLMSGNWPTRTAFVRLPYLDIPQFPLDDFLRINQELIEASGFPGQLS